MKGSAPVHHCGVFLFTCNGVSRVKSHRAFPEIVLGKSGVSGATEGPSVPGGAGAKTTLRHGVDAPVANLSDDEAHEPRCERDPDAKKAGVPDAPGKTADRCKPG